MNRVVVAQLSLQPKRFGTEFALVDQLADVSFLVLQEIIALSVSPITSFEFTLVGLFASVDSEVPFQELEEEFLDKKLITKFHCLTMLLLNFLAHTSHSNGLRPS